MFQLAIPIPSLPGSQDVDIEMTIAGEKHKMHFKVEMFQWEQCNMPQEQRVECIRQLIHDYGKDWMIYQIGIPTEQYVPLTFVKTDDWERQRLLMLKAVMDR